MKNLDLPDSGTVKLALVLALGVGAYFVVKKITSVGGDAAAAVKDFVTTTANPASDKNIVYRNLPESFTEKVGDFLGWAFDNENYTKYKAATENGGMSNTKTQNVTAAPPAAPATEKKLKFNPIWDKKTPTIAGVGAIPIDFKRKK